MKGQLFRRYCTLDLCLVYTGIISPCLTDQSIHGSFSAPRVLHHKSVTLNEDRANGQPTCQPPLHAKCPIILHRPISPSYHP